MCLYLTCTNACYEAILATGLTPGLRRIPAGFYVEVQADDIQWQTTNKPVHVGLDVLEWDQRIVL
jgi:hypothetical protein